MQDFIKKIMEYCTRENITLAIALIGAIGTISNWIISFLHSRRNISLQVIKICQFRNSVVAYISIQNNSRLPVSITDISLKIGKHLYTGINVPPHTIKIEKKSGYSITASREYTSMIFPVNLGSLSGVSGYIFFDISKEDYEMLSTPLTVQVSTNRGNSFEKKLSIAEWSDWEKMF